MKTTYIYVCVPVFTQKAGGMIGNQPKGKANLSISILLNESRGNSQGRWHMWTVGLNPDLWETGIFFPWPVSLLVLAYLWLLSQLWLNLGTSRLRILNKERESDAHKAPRLTAPQVHSPFVKTAACCPWVGVPGLQELWALPHPNVVYGTVLSLPLVLIDSCCKFCLPTIVPELSRTYRQLRRAPLNGTVSVDWLFL